MYPRHMGAHTRTSSLPASAVCIVGGGGHAKVVIETLLSQGVPIRGVYDDAPKPPACATGAGTTRLGPLADATDLPGGTWILALGDLALRRIWLGRIASSPRDSIAHPSAIISPSAALGAGVWVGPGAIVHTDATVHRHAILNSACVVEHDCLIGESAHIAPGAVICGSARIGDFALIGAGAVVLPGITIGAGAIIGAGSVVVRHIEPGVTAFGSPAASRRS